MPASTVWLILAVALIVGETMTVGLTFIWFALGAIGGLIVALLGGDVPLQRTVFLLVSAASLALMRPMTARWIKKKTSPTNADRVIGMTAVVSEDIRFAEGTGQVKIAGQIWSARSAHGTDIPAGSEVKVLRIEGVKVFVEPIDTST